MTDIVSICASKAKKAAVIEDAEPEDGLIPASTISNSIFARFGGAYIPPAKLRALTALIVDKTSDDYQRLSWEALKKSINGLINKANTSNLKRIVPELISENLVRGRGLFCRSIMRSQMVAAPFTPIYAALVAIVNSKFPAAGEMLCARLILLFRRAFRRNDKAVCLSTTRFLGHLVNQRVAHEIVALQIATLLLERATDDSIEVVVGFLRECGANLSSSQPRAFALIFERLRAILHEKNSLEVRSQYMIEVLFHLRKENFADHPGIPKELDLVEEADQVTHMLSLDDEDLPIQEDTNFYDFDEDFVQNELRYAKIRHEILGDSSDDDSDIEGSDGFHDTDEDENEIQENSGIGNNEADRARSATIKANSGGQDKILDATGGDIIALRKVIYLTIMSSLDFEECCHKLLRLDLPAGHEEELCSMVIECCSQERTFVKFYGLLAQRLCRINILWAKHFSEQFSAMYSTIHRYEAARIRNIARLFAHLFGTRSIEWDCLSCVRLTEDETTSSSRIFLKILLQDVQATMGLHEIVTRFREPQYGNSFDGLFPRDHPRSTRFAINYWTSIGLGAVTEDIRDWLKESTAVIAANAAKAAAEAATINIQSSKTTIREEQSRTRSPSRKSSRRRSLSKTRRRRSLSNSSRMRHRREYVRDDGRRR